MKYIITFLIVFATLYTYGQNARDTIRIGDDYAASKGKPIVAHDGTIILVQTDSIYLINGVRYRFYGGLRGYLDDSLDFKTEGLILAYEKNLLETDRIFKDLLRNCTENSKMNDMMLRQTRASLSATQATLDLSQKSLLAANGSLADANEQLRKAKKKNLMKTLITGAGGLSIGILIGILVTP